MLNHQIRTLRLVRGMSQVELARRLGVTKQSVSNWENDNIQPSIEMLKKLADIFSVSTDYLLGLEKEEFIDVSGLPPGVVTHLRQVVEDFRILKKEAEEKKK
ncbi:MULTISPECIES: helix-turn-helix domain-containing protein [Intestinimonas]|uniref:helix-turn-helix domain-containing protein n=1 Tax=Intestinimonas TaxID=1392389 RepID=UPI00195B5487|nr:MULTISPECIES: helix-turn-helix transcriptional regulator [Intestinimonas]MBM6917217.1 helix-turn-helix transcriptional regulator [Intestinimonas butyriciproducens]MBU5433525.1 helix-turn-helix domain-containing protein [Intestinimonas sp. MSJ-38]